MSFKKIITSHFSTLIITSVYLATSLFIYRYVIFKEGLVINADVTRPYFLKDFWQFYVYLWDEHGNFATSFHTSQLLSLLPFFALGFLFKLKTFTLVSLMYVTFTFLAGLNMYALSKHLLKNHFQFQRSDLESSLSGFFYMFSPLLIAEIRHLFIIFAYALLPLIVFLLIKGIEGKRNIHFILLGFLWSVASGALQYVFYIAILIIFSFTFYTIYDFRKSRQFTKIQTSVSKVVISFLAFLVFSAYWIIPNLVERGSDFYKTDRHTLDLLYRNATLPKLLNLKVDYQVDFFYMTKGTTNPKQGLFDKSTWFLVATLPLNTFFVRKRKTGVKQLLFFNLLFLLVAILTLFRQTISKTLFDLILFSSPGSDFFARAFRSPRIHHLIFLPVALNFGYFLAFLREKANRQVEIVRPFYLAMILLASWPLLTGDVNGQLKKVTLPSEFLAARSFLASEKRESAVLWSPPYGSNVAEWNPWNQASIFEVFLTPKRTFATGDNRATNYLKEVLSWKDTEVPESLIKESPENLAKLLKPLGVKYWVIHSDVYYEKPRIYQALKNLTESREFRLVKQQGYLYIFALEMIGQATETYPIFYVPEEIIIFKENTLKEKILAVDQSRLNAYVAERDINLLPGLPHGSSPSPGLEFKKNNPTSYTVAIKGSSRPYLLVFLESFSPNWEARIIGKSPSLLRHLQVNSFANGWLVEEDGDYFIEIRYRSQRYFYQGVVISTAALILFTVYSLKIHWPHRARSWGLVINKLSRNERP